MGRAADVDPLLRLKARICPGVWGFRSCTQIPPLEGWLPQRANWGTWPIPFSGKEEGAGRSRNLNSNCNWGVGAPGSGGPRHTRFGHSPLTRSKGKETRGGETRKGFTSVRPTPEGHQTNISKTASKCLEHSQVSVRRCGRKVSRCRPVSS